MDCEAALAIKRVGIGLVAVVVALGCGGSLSADGGPAGSGGGGGAGDGSPAACCPRGGVSIATVVRARGFTAYEGRPVKAALLYSIASRATSETSVSRGAFDLAFPPDPPTCSDVFAMNAAGAIYIDTDGDGVCNPAVDYLYAWSAFGAAGGTCATIDLTPQSPKCGGVTESPDFMVIEAAQAVCPATNNCLSCRSDGDGGAVVTCLI